VFTYSNVSGDSWSDIFILGSEQLLNHERAIVSLVRVLFASSYDAKFILKWFRKEGFVQAPIG